MNRQKLVNKYLPVDYVDCFSREVVGDVTVDDVFDRMFCALPSWGRTMLRLRDAMVRPFGLKTGISFADRILLIMK